MPGFAHVDVDDPDGKDDLAIVTVAEEPEHGQVLVFGQDLVFLPEPGFVGEDSFTVAVEDHGTGKPRTGTPVSTELTVVATVEAGDAVLGCGCATGEAPAGGLVVGVGLLAAAGRRRRR